MMQAEICVDYLSHQWDCEDLIQTFKETRKQHQKYIVENITTTTSLLTRNERKLKRSEQYKLYRFENALWRAMARHCTSQLSQTNQLVDPSTVSWQKESDITWLYGPKYTKSIILSNNIDQQQSAEHFTQSAILESKNMSRTIVSEHEDDTITYHKAQTFTIERPITTTTTKTTTSLQSLKPVLKKHSNVTQMLPTYSESIFSYFDSPQVLLTSSEYSCYSIAHSPILLSDYNNQTRSSISSISSSDNSSITSISSNSVSTTNKPGVHFNPEIIEIEYQPEHPVSLERSSLISARIYQDKYNCLSDGDDCYVQEEAEEEDDDDDDELWSLIAEAGASIKLSTTYTRLAFLVQYLFSYHHHRPHNNKTSKKCSKVQQQQHQVKSVAAATTTTNVSIVPLFISMMKSVVSLTTTWLLYQSLSPLTWLAKKSTSHPHHHNHTHHRRHPHRRSTATSSITTPATL